MSVTVASFRADFPLVFGNNSAYPDQAIQYWLAVATIMLGISQGAPPTVCSFTGSIEGNVLTITAINFGSMSLLPLALTGENVPVNMAVISQLTGPQAGPGKYQLNLEADIAAENMVAVQSGLAVGTNPFWGASSTTPNSPPSTLADIALENWVAHQLVLEKQAIAAALAGGDPGTKIGVVSSKSVGSVSVSFDVSSLVEEGAGYYNQTIYGMRFWRLAKAVSGGPIQIGIGRAPPFLFFNNWGLTGSYSAWGGPYPGIQASDTGFG
jgi:hypothetical protein